MLRRTKITLACAAGLAAGAATVLPVTTAIAAPAGSAGPAAATAAACATPWGTKAKVAAHAETSHTARVLGGRAGRHACFERLVVDLGRGTAPGYRVQYVRAFHAQGSGKLIKLRGHAILQISLHAKAGAAFPSAGHAVTSVAGFRELRQVLSGGSFEGYTAIGVGVQAKKPFRVELLKGPGRRSRLVIDVAIR